MHRPQTKSGLPGRSPTGASANGASPAGAKGGFTLVEIMVALGIAAGTLVLVMGSTNESMRTSIRARERSTVEGAAESKLAECLLGTELLSSGELPGHPGWRWEVGRTRAELAELETLKRFRFQVKRPDGSRVISWTVLDHIPEKAQ